MTLEGLQPNRTLGLLRQSWRGFHHTHENVLFLSRPRPGEGRFYTFYFFSFFAFPKMAKNLFAAQFAFPKMAKNIFAAQQILHKVWFQNSRKPSTACSKPQQPSFTAYLPLKRFFHGTHESDARQAVVQLIIGASRRGCHAPVARTHTLSTKAATQCAQTRENLNRGLLSDPVIRWVHPPLRV